MSTVSASLNAPPANRKAFGALMLIGFAWLIVRLVYAGWRQLVPDEAYYWVWSRHLSMSYFDHPPGVAYLIKLSTMVFGSTELGVRFFAVTMSLGTIAVVVWIGARLLQQPRAAAWAGAILLSSPLMTVLGTIMTSDTPAIFFATCALAIAVAAANRPAERAGAYWLLFGLFAGAGLLCKYTAILAPAAVFLALLSCAEGRRHMRKPWVYLAGILSLAIFSPVLIWNSQHQWVSFLFQFRHGLAGGRSPLLANLGGFIGGQLLVLMPILFAIGMASLWWHWRRHRQLDLPRRILLYCATLPLLAFTFSATRSKVEMNWPAFLYPPLSLLIGDFLLRQSNEQWRAWARTGCGVAVIAMLLIQAPELLGRRMPPAADSMFGWRQIARRLDEVPYPIICGRYQDASLASFYMTGQPDITAEKQGSRPSAFDYFDKPNFAGIPRLVYVGNHAMDFCREHPFRVVRSEFWAVPSFRPRKLQIVELERVDSPAPDAGRNPATDPG